MSRQAWVDTSKGIVISLMVLGHSNIPHILSAWIWSFHMPFFFIISALFTSWDKECFHSFFIRRTKILILPFIVYSLINLILYPFALDVNHIDYFIKILHKGWGGVALWFVPVFYLSLLATKYTPRRLLLPVALFLCILGCLLCLDSIVLPWAMSSVPFAASLMMTTRRYQTDIKSAISALDKKRLFSFTFVGVSISLIVSHFYILDMASNSINPIIPIIIGVIAGNAAIICLSVLLSKYASVIAGPFVHIGRNTYEIMALSQVIIAIINHSVPMPSVFKYMAMVLILISAVYLRKFIEGKFSDTEAI